jgi:signal recognition particle subunit SRP54
MAFESISQKIQDALKKLTRRGKLNEQDTKSAMREIRLALLEADVHYLVVKHLVNKISTRAVGAEIMESLTPGQQVVKIVREELTALMGDKHEDVQLPAKGTGVILLAGLQGAGKTTTAAKLGLYLRGKGRTPALIACDMSRPAAVEQLRVLGKSTDMPVYAQDKGNAVAIAKDGIKWADKQGCDTVIVDTAGRMHVQQDLMEELKQVAKVTDPSEILLVVDAMTGQDAVNTAQAFEEAVGISGVILTKLDGDTRGGAALSVREVIHKPIKLVGMGEKLTKLEAFHPSRMADRILGMGDVLSLIEKAEQSLDIQKAQEFEKKVASQELTLADFLSQLQQIKKMGPLTDLMDMVPGMKGKMAGVNPDERQLGRTEAIIQSMTPKERRQPSIMNASRRKRVAKGSGTTIQDVNRLLKSFEEFKKVMKQFGKGKRPALGNLRFPM